MDQQIFSTMVDGKEITIKTGKYAQAANAMCWVQCGQTVVMVTAVMSKTVRPGMGFFPLMVDYEEKMYAAGRIKGSRFIKREGRPTDEAVLVGRFIDRAIRPLFDERIKNDVQVIVTTLAFDGENDPDILGLIGASCALHMSDIPWNGPIGAVRVSRVGESWVLNPTYEQREESLLDLDLAGTAEKIVMIEARANEAQEPLVQEAFEKGIAALQPIIDVIEQVRSANGKEKQDLFSLETEEAKEAAAKKEALTKEARDFIIARFQELALANPMSGKPAIAKAKEQIKEELTAHLAAKDVEEDDISFATGLIYEATQDAASDLILTQGKRIDGRALDEIRPLQSDAGVLPRVHGSGHFSRGTTQVLGVCTLGSPGDEQTLDGMETVGQKRYMHHYNFPPYSVGEAKPLRSTGRREIGHGALAEKALMPMLPSKEDFPYSIRVVSEVLNSNGSSSMASTCASTLTLMDAGVPIKAPVAGIAMGLASNGDDWKVLTDLQDIEDGKGGMDFKITGSREGITAIQMDTKTTGLTIDIIRETLERSKDARLQILDVMEQAIDQPREDLSEFAPRILTLTIDPDKIRDVIGPGGKMINEIIEKTGVDSIDIEQNGLVFITAPSKTTGQKAYEWVNNLTRDVEVGESLEGKVERILDFGAIVEVLPGRTGLVHISELAPWRVGKVEDIVSVGDTIQVKVIEIDDMNRINLSMKQAEGNTYTEEMKAKAQTSKPPSGRPPRDRGPRPPRKPFKKR